jgi:1-aminocyclopropane-1-carboxylate deaminase/D-cysteine desulfhydrase-like pyridoxal-dependent ACC family enzyme
MHQADIFRERFPILGRQLPRTKLATLPTPVREVMISSRQGKRRVSIKYDNLTAGIYGGNKVRKLEYIFPRAIEKHRLRLATFGAVGSNHALATALYARKLGFDCTCFLSHQANTPLVAATLNMHIRNGTELIRYGGAYSTRLGVLRESLWGRHVWLIPMGGSSWLGTIGFVAAGLELAAQIANGEISVPDRIYVGAGTMGTAVGIALGLAIAGLETEVHAVRVSDASIMNAEAMQHLLHKTAEMMYRLDDSVPAGIVSRSNIRMRNSFFGPGYARTTSATNAAIDFARNELGLTLESTYTGKVMAALLADMRRPETDELNLLFWHTYNSVPFTVPTDRPLDEAALPGEFLRYFANRGP